MKMNFETNSGRDRSGCIAAAVLGGILFFVCVSFLAAGGGFKRIDAGQVGVRFDAVSGGAAAVVTPKLEFYYPTERLIVYPSSLLTTSFVKAKEGDRADRDDSVIAATSSGTSLNLDVSVSWRVQADAINQVFTNFGEAETAKISNEYLRPLTNAAVNIVTGNLAVDDILVQRRGDLNRLIRDELVKMVGPLGITVDDVNVGEIYTPEEVTKAIDRLIEARNRLQLLSKQEQTAVQEARKIKTEAQRQAEESRLLSQLGEKAIQSRKLENERLRVERWNGSEVIIGPNGR